MRARGGERKRGGGKEEQYRGGRLSCLWPKRRGREKKTIASLSGKKEKKGRKTRPVKGEKNNAMLEFWR